MIEFTLNEGSFLNCLLIDRVFSGDILVKEKIWDILLDKNSTLVTSSLVTIFSYLCSFVSQTFVLLIFSFSLFSNFPSFNVT